MSWGRQKVRRLPAIDWSRGLKVPMGGIIRRRALSAAVAITVALSGSRTAAISVPLASTLPGKRSARYRPSSKQDG
jgi:hypothetical protein